MNKLLDNVYNFASVSIGMMKLCKFVICVSVLLLNIHNTSAQLQKRLVKFAKYGISSGISNLVLFDSGNLYYFGKRAVKNYPEVYDWNFDSMQKWKNNGTSFLNNGKIIKKYDAKNNTIFTNTFYINNTGTAIIPNDRTYFAFNSNNNRIQEIREYYSTITNKYEISYKADTIYKNNLIDSVIYYNNFLNNGKYTKVYFETFIYDSKKRLIETTKYQTEGSTPLSYPPNRTLKYIYNANDQLTKTSWEQSWDKATSKYLASNVHEYKYNANGLLLVDRILYNNIPSGKDSFHYNALALKDSAWTEGASGAMVDLYVYKYNSNKQLSEEKKFTNYSSVLKKFNNYSILTKHYNFFGKDSIEFFGSNFYNNVNFYSGVLATYTYWSNKKIKRISKLKSNPYMPMYYPNVFDYSQSFDNDGDLIVYKNSMYNDTNVNFANYYYYDTFTPSTVSSKKIITTTINAFPNPATAVIQVKINEPFIGKTEVKIYNQLGGLMIYKNLNPNYNEKNIIIDLPQHIPNQCYYGIIENQNRRFSFQFIKK